MSQKTGRKLRRHTEESDEKSMKHDSGDANEIIGKDGEAKEDDLKGFAVDDNNCKALNGTESSQDASQTNQQTSQMPSIADTKIIKEDIENNTEEKVENKAEEKDNEIKEQEKENGPIEIEKNTDVLYEEIDDENDDSENQEELDKLTLVEDSDEKLAENVDEKCEPSPEPIVLEGEEPDPELQFDENSDAESRKGSPVIRCKTRRSLTRNIPTPKTPKSFLEANGDDKNSEYSDKQSIVTVPTPEITDNESEVSSFRHVTDVESTKFSLDFSGSNDFSMNNLSTKAVVGDDLTQNDASYNFDTDCSSFLDLTKDKSVGETLRNLSSRRTIRPVRDYQKLVHQLNNQREYKNLHLQARQSVELVTGGLKRKNLSSMPDNTKRFKSEPFKSEPPGLFSYISSPIASFRNLFAKSEIPSSTPKLTGYKNKSIFENPNVSKIDLDMAPLAEDTTEKKGGCIFM